MHEGKLVSLFVINFFLKKKGLALALSLINCAIYPMSFNFFLLFLEIIFLLLFIIALDVYINLYAIIHFYLHYIALTRSFGVFHY
jgi:hypothetical protein